MEIHLIWAQDFNGGIGKDGQLPWHIPEDLKNFKKLTLDSPIIMGRKTWDSLPFKPLPKRRNIVLSSQKSIDTEVYHNIDDCLAMLQNESINKVFVIGGSSIYKLFFDYAHQLHITFVKINTHGLDTFFPINMDIINKFFIKRNTQTISKYADYTHWIKK